MKKIYKILLALFMLFVTIGSVLGLTTLSVSRVNFLDGSADSWNERFQIFLIEGANTEGNQIIQARDVNNLLSSNVQVKNDVNINSNLKEYVCEYGYSQAPSGENVIYDYFIYSERFASWNCNEDYILNNINLIGEQEAIRYFKATEGVLPYCYVVIREPLYSVGFPTAPISEFEIDYNLIVDGEQTEVKTVTSKDSGQIYLKDGNDVVASVNYLQAGLASKFTCPEASTAQQKAIQNIGSVRYNLLPSYVVDEILVEQSNFGREFSEWYNSKVGLFGIAPNLDDVTTYITNYIDEPISKLPNYFTNKMIGQTGLVNVYECETASKCYDALAAGQIPVYPAFTLEIKGSWIGIIKPLPTPTIKRVDSGTIKITSGDTTKINVEVSNIGGGEGDIKVYGVCDNNLIKVDDFWIYDLGVNEKVRKDVGFVTLSSSTIKTNCKVYAEYNSVNKAYIDVSVESTAAVSCVSGQQRCVNNDIWQCVDNNWGNAPVAECEEGTVCNDNDNTAAFCEDTIFECRVDDDCSNSCPIDTTPKCKTPIFGIGDNYCECEEITPPPEFPWLLIGMIGGGFFGLMIFGGISIKAFVDKNFPLFGLMLAITLVSLGFFGYGALMWLGLVLSILLLLSVFFIIGSVFAFKIPGYGSIVGSALILIGMILLMIVVIAVVIKTFNLTSMLNISLL